MAELAARGLKVDYRSVWEFVHLLRKAAARTLETVCAAIGEILSAYTPAECANYFRNSSYQT